MVESQQSTKQNKSRSLFEKIFKKKNTGIKDSPPCKCKEPRKHDQKGDENGNAKSQLTEPPAKHKGAAGGKRTWREFRSAMFRRKKKNPSTATEAPIYVELSPSCSTFMPDIISHAVKKPEISQAEPHKKLTDQTSAQFQTHKVEHSHPQAKERDSNVKLGCSSPELLIQEPKRNQDSGNVDDIVEDIVYDIVDSKQTVSKYQRHKGPFKKSTSSQSPINEKSEMINSKQPENPTTTSEAEGDVPPGVYAKMCRKSNRMLQTFNRSGSKRRLDRSFLRWHSIADLQSYTGKSSPYKKWNRAAMKTPNELKLDKSRSLQDLPSRVEDTNTKPTELLDRVKPRLESAKISKVRPSFDKALSKSEYDLPNVPNSPTSRGILAFKKVRLSNLSQDNRNTRPRSAVIIPESYCIPHELHVQNSSSYAFAESTGALHPVRTSTPIKNQHNGNFSSPTPIEESDSSVNHYSDYFTSQKSACGTLGRTHSCQDKYEAPVVQRRDMQRNYARPKSCIQADLNWFPAWSKTKECQLPNSRRTNGVSRSRSRVRSIAKRYNLTTSTENLSSSRLVTCKANNWTSVDLDMNSEYCTMKPLLHNALTRPSEDLPSHSHAQVYLDMNQNVENRTVSRPIDSKNADSYYICRNITRPACYDSSYSSNFPYFETSRSNMNTKRQKVFYALDV